VEELRACVSQLEETAKEQGRLAAASEVVSREADELRRRASELEARLRDQESIAQERAEACRQVDQLRLRVNELEQDLEVANQRSKDELTAVQRLHQENDALREAQAGWKQDERLAEGLRAHTAMLEQQLGAEQANSERERQARAEMEAALRRRESESAAGAPQSEELSRRLEEAGRERDELQKRVETLQDTARQLSHAWDAQLEGHKEQMEHRHREQIRLLEARHQQQLQAIQAQLEQERRGPARETEQLRQEVGVQADRDKPSTDPLDSMTREAEILRRERDSAVNELQALERARLPKPATPGEGPRVLPFLLTAIVCLIAGIVIAWLWLSH
jgi:hypothetical protein